MKIEQTSLPSSPQIQMPVMLYPGQEAYGKSMRENIPAHVLRQIKEEIKNA